MLESLETLKFVTLQKTRRNLTFMHEDQMENLKHNVRTQGSKGKENWISEFK